MRSLIEIVNLAVDGAYFYPVQVEALMAQECAERPTLREELRTFVDAYYFGEQHQHITQLLGLEEKSERDNSQ